MVQWREDLHELIAERYERTATIITSSLDFNEWDQAFASNPLLASATLDRLRHNAAPNADHGGDKKQEFNPIKRGQIWAKSKPERCQFERLQLAPMCRKQLAPLCRKMTLKPCHDHQYRRA